MKTRLSLIAIGLASIGLASCASHHRDTLSSAPGASPERERVRPGGARESYVGRVQQAALERGLEVHWVNPPDQALASNE